MKRTKEQIEEGERLQKQKGRAATVTRTMNMKPTRQRQKVELFEPDQSAKRARPSPPPKKKKPLKVNVGKIAAALRAFLTGEGDELVAAIHANHRTILRRITRGSRQGLEHRVALHFMVVLTDDGLAGDDSKVRQQDLQ